MKKGSNFFLILTKIVSLDTVESEHLTSAGSSVFNGALKTELCNSFKIWLDCSSN